MGYVYMLLSWDKLIGMLISSINEWSRKRLDVNLTTLTFVNVNLK